jgi:hypothetical protein
MTHGSTTHTPGDPLYMLETVVGSLHFFKVFTSDRRIARGTTQAGLMRSRKTYVLRTPTWEELP